MAYDVFISHSQKDKLTADAICRTLESEGIRCWIAPRDVAPGSEWTEAIMNGIEGCRAFVLVFSDQANLSEHVKREVAHAFAKGLKVFPIRVENVVPARGLAYFLESVQWMDAFPLPIEKYLDNLAQTVKSVLSDRAVEPRELEKLGWQIGGSTEKAASPPADSKARIGISKARIGIVVGGAAALVILCALTVYFVHANASVEKTARGPEAPFKAEGKRPEIAGLKLGRVTFLTDRADSVKTLASYLQEKGAQVSSFGTAQFNDVAVTRPDIIIVGADTGGVWQRTSKTMLKRLFENYKVVGLGLGGAELFAQLDLRIASFNAMHLTESRVTLELPELLQFPLSVPAPDRVVEIYYPSQADVLGIYDEGSPAVAGFEGIARSKVWKNHWIISRQGSYLLWGFSASASEMTETGRRLFVNLLANHEERPAVPLSRAGIKVNYVKPGLISDRLTKQFPGQNWPFVLQQRGRIIARLSWNPPEQPLALIVGPQQRNAVARKDGVSPLALEYNITEEDVARDADWHTSVQCFGDLGCTAVDYRLELSFPTGSDSGSGKR